MNQTIYLFLHDNPVYSLLMSFDLNPTALTLNFLILALTVLKINFRFIWTNFLPKIVRKRQEPAYKSQPANQKDF